MPSNAREREREALNDARYASCLGRSCRDGYHSTLCIQQRESIDSLVRAVREADKEAARGTNDFVVPGPTAGMYWTGRRDAAAAIEALERDE